MPRLRAPARARLAPGERAAPADDALRAASEAARLPSASELAALRAWYAGVNARTAVVHYLGARRATGQSSRALLSAIRRRAARLARARQREDLASLIEHPAAERRQRERAVLHALELLRRLPVPEPRLTDGVAHWLPVRAARAMQAQGIQTLADLTVRVQRRRRWWAQIPGLGAASAQQVQAFFAAHAHLTEQARALIAQPLGPIAPWEQLRVPGDLDGSCGLNRAPAHTCVLEAENDYDAVQAWLNLQEAASTERAYRKEVERLMLWVIVERGKALSSLKFEDALAYRGFLRRPMPAQRWTGPARPRAAADWRPFQGPLSPPSVSYALAVLSALFRWLIEQRYVLANPFAGVKGKGGRVQPRLDATRMFTAHEWALLRATADQLEDSPGGWSLASAQRLRFVLDFAYATGVRPGELVGARLGHIRPDAAGQLWLHVLGKGQRAGSVALPALAQAALQRSLAERGLSTSSVAWDPRTPLVGRLAEEEGGITRSRLWAIVQRFFEHAAQALQGVSVATVRKLQSATTHWMRHTHATHALEAGVELSSVRDNLRHASIATTSIYLHTDDARRARQIGAAFPAPGNR